MSGMRALVQEDFAGFQAGCLHADFTARGEYYCLRRPDYPNGWYDPINHTGARSASVGGRYWSRLFAPCTSPTCWCWANTK